MNPNQDSSLMRQYIKSLHAPFNSVSPRFNYTKASIEGRQKPGPGAYSLAHAKAMSSLDTSAAFRAASRDKDSLFGKMMRRPNLGPGPGAYSNNSTIVKKSFNTSLTKS